MITCCYECVDREVLCHTKCVRYIVSKGIYEHKKETLKKARLHGSNREAQKYKTIMFNKDSNNKISR